MKHPCVTCLRLRVRPDNKTADDTVRICNECMDKDKDKGLNDIYFSLPEVERE